VNPPRRLSFAAGTSEATITAAVEAAGGFVPGSIVQLDVLHDDGCPKLDGGACRCEPSHQVEIRLPRGAA
jgi:hypothetical protein